MLDVSHAKSNKYFDLGNITAQIILSLNHLTVNLVSFSANDLHLAAPLVHPGTLLSPGS
jgi:hypothetical protein